MIGPTVLEYMDHNLRLNKNTVPLSRMSNTTTDTLENKLDHHVTTSITTVIDNDDKDINNIKSCSEENDCQKNSNITLSMASTTTSPPLMSVDDVNKFDENGDKVRELHAALSRVKQESEDKIEKLRQESENATKIIERLQLQLQQQADYENLKQEISLLKSGPLTHSDSSINPVNATSTLEMLLFERAKAMQNVTSHNSFKTYGNDVSGGMSSNLPLSTSTSSSSFYPTTLGSGLTPNLFFPSSMPPVDMLSIMNEDVISHWKRSFENSQLKRAAAAAAAAVGIKFPTSSLVTSPSYETSENNAPVSPPRISTTTSPLPTSIIIPRISSPGCEHTTSPLSPTSNQKVDNNLTSFNTDISTSTSVSPCTPSSRISLANGSSKPSSEDAGSPFRRSESKSPIKLESGFLPLSSSGASMEMPSMPLTTLMNVSRIPKSDPMESKLQDMLRFNMDKFAGQPLDTLSMSRRVRELLSVHNIGQRLFAKYILGLSQGTVSELLSKPKSWEKLTEKGRESYRKMHAWCYDEQAVLLLKSMIPRKGELVKPAPSNFRNPSPSAYRENTTPSQLLKEASIDQQKRLAAVAAVASGVFPFGPGRCSPSNIDNHGSFQEENIAKFLDHAALKVAVNTGLTSTPNSDNTSASVASMSFGSVLSTNSTNNLFSPQGGPVDEIRMREFSKLMHMSEKGMNIENSDYKIPLTSGASEISKTGQLFAAGVNHMFSCQRTPPIVPADLQRVMDVYQQELAKFQQNAIVADNLKNSSQNGYLTNGIEYAAAKNEETVCKVERPITSSAESMQDATMSLNVNKGLGSSLFPPGAPVEISSNSEANKSALSPLQRMASITNSLVNQSSLSSNGGSNQRQLKIILPPISQQQFDCFSHLNTDETVRRIKDILSQYSISQRLFGESVLGLSQGSVSDLLARPKPWHMLTQKGKEPFIRMKIFLEDETAVHTLVASQYKIAPEKLMRTAHYAGMSGSLHHLNLNHAAQKPKLPFDFPLGVQDSAFAAYLPPFFSGHEKQYLDASLLDPAMLNKNLLSSNKGPGNFLNAPVPSLYEMAALTDKLDTLALTTKIKEILLANNVGQKLFGDSVLKLSQGSVSELLSKPKPWGMLSIKGREPYVRMQLWLNDPHNIEKLHALKNEQRENRKKRGYGEGDSLSDRSSPCDHGEFGSGPESPGSSIKKQRMLFSSEQKEALLIAFTLDPYPTPATIEFMSQELNIDIKSITNWFHNHRMRLKQQMSLGVNDHTLLNKEGSFFDPIKFRLILHQRRIHHQEITESSNGGSELSEYISNNRHPFENTISRHNSEEINGIGFLRSDTGLDLTFKREHDKESVEEDCDVSNMGSDGEDSVPSSSRCQVISEASVQSATTVTVASSGCTRSRRKAAAPQWVRPEWMMSDPDPELARSVNIINDVCITNSIFHRDQELNRTGSVGGSPSSSESPIRSPNTQH